MSVKKITIAILGGSVFAAATALLILNQIPPVFTNSQAQNMKQSDRSGELNIHEEVLALKRDLDRLKDVSRDFQRLSSTIKDELAMLRSQYANRFTNIQDEGQIQARPDYVFVETESQSEQDSELILAQEQKTIDERVDRQMTLMDDTINTEADDKSWSETAEQSLQDALQGIALEGYYLEGADCQTTLCRISISFDENMDTSEGLRDIDSVIRWNGASFARVDEETGEINIYLAREGYSLPRIDNE